MEGRRAGDAQLKVGAALDELDLVLLFHVIGVGLVHQSGLWEALHLDGCGLEQRLLRRQQWNG